MSKKKINILLSLTNPIVSVNALYSVGVKYAGGRPVAYKYKSPKAKLYCQEVGEQFRALDMTEHLEWLKESKLFTLKITFIFKRNGLKRDTSNSCKCIEDVWVNFLRDDVGIADYDDSKHAQVILQKFILPGAKQEYVIFELEPFEGELRYDKTPKPTNVCIHSSLDLKKFIKKLPKKTQTTTDPCDDATDSDLFVLESIQSPLEIINSVYRRSESGFCYIGCLGFDPDPDLISTITLLSQGKSNIKIARIQDVTDLIDWFK